MVMKHRFVQKREKLRKVDLSGFGNELFSYNEGLQSSCEFHSVLFEYSSPHFHLLIVINVLIMHL